MILYFKSIVGNIIAIRIIRISVRGLNINICFLEIGYFARIQNIDENKTNIESR